MGRPFERLSKVDQTRLLLDILEHSKHRGGKAARPVVVFDLDGTLLDNRTRTRAILHEFAASTRETHAAFASTLETLVEEHIHYGIAPTLERMGIVDAPYIERATAFWKDRFFHDPHLHHDVPLKGAVAYARACYERGAIVAYVTGRDLPYMSLGTFKSLRDHGFPIGISGTELVLKPNPEIPDETFKRDVAPELRRIGDVIAAFDNEPGNCNLFLEEYPESFSVLLDTQHAPNPPGLLPKVHVIEDFETIA
ncbi:MAG: HAD family hydrolase [Polyangiaceae bacterium]|nr:HAD family hydrolase [Polyangiaceae bacterium]